MPEKINRTIGLSFSKKELEEMMGRSLDLDNDLDFEEAVETLENYHADEKFAEYGFDDCYQIDEISGDLNGLWLYFM